ncbi:MAG TPA: Fe-Mn family superoxide dismutase [Burkholderiales bacterium]|nr:Fe-Mn family superoxide dismutase [Burkholderiales bacterium]
MKRYALKPLHCRPWLLQGLSPKLIESHYENNYGGALKRLNAIAAELDGADFARLPGFTLNGLKREELIAHNSVILHELYFASLGGDGRDPGSFAEVLTRDFGSVDRWKAEFAAMGRALGGGSGWVLLTHVPRDGTLVNQYASDHSQSLASAIPILALDMYEHAYHIDFGANAAAYVDTFLRNIDWKGVAARYHGALKVEPLADLVQKEFGDLPGVSVEEVKTLLDSGQRVQFIDARPKHYVTRTQDIIDGATWRDPERVKEWAGELSKSDPVVVFCVYGFHIGCQTAGTLREAGFDAKYMKGGHAAWKAIGGPVKRFP